jgi:hypothetical protein
VREGLQDEEQAEAARQIAHGVHAVRVRGLLQGLQVQVDADLPPEEAQRLLLSPLRKKLRKSCETGEAQESLQQSTQVKRKREFLGLTMRTVKVAGIEESLFQFDKLPEITTKDI